MDKGLSKQLFQQAGIPTPVGITLKNGQQADPAAGAYELSFKALNTCSA